MNEEDKIKLSNNDIYFYASVSSFGRKSFDKLQKIVTVSGKTQYWVYKLWKHIVSLAEDAEKVRMELIKKYCIKDEEGSPVTTDDEKNPGMKLFSFSKENRIIFDGEMEEFMNIINDIPINKIEISSDLLERMNKNQHNDDVLLSSDMINLEKIIKFTE